MLSLCAVISVVIVVLSLVLNLLLSLWSCFKIVWIEVYVRELTISYIFLFINKYSIPFYVSVDRNKMRIRKGHLRLSPNEEAALIKEETEKRRKLRLQQVREQSKENAAKIRRAVKQEKHKQLMSLATDIKVPSPWPVTKFNNFMDFI